MSVNREILMTIVKNSSNRLEGEQEILEINEQQLCLITKELSKKSSLHVLGQLRELLDAFVCTMKFDVKHETYEEDINYFLENVKADELDKPSF